MTEEQKDQIRQLFLNFVRENLYVILYAVAFMFTYELTLAWRKGAASGKVLGFIFGAIAIGIVRWVILNI